MSRGLVSRLIVAFVLSVACFCGSTLYSESISNHIDEAALSIASNAMPSIEHLANTRGELRHLDVAVARLEQGRSAAQLAEVARARAAVDEAFDSYLALPVTYAGEQALWAEMHRGLAAVDRAVDEAMAERPPPLASPHVTSAINEASAAIRRAIDFNAAHSRELALRIETGRRRSTRVALLLDLLSTLFTAGAAFLTVRALMHHGRIVEERNQLVARRAEELEQFAGRVAHDILGPLSATTLAIGLVGDQVTDPGQRRSLERGQRGIARVASIVDGLLRFARAGARPDLGAITTVGPVVQSVIADLQPEAAALGITLAMPLPPDCSIHGHAGVLASVVENLVRNAIKYMGERPERRIDVRVAASLRWVRIEVADSGPGIAPSLVPTIFDAHVRGRTNGQPGLGLGLATVKRIAESHGGRCGVESSAGHGSTFFIELPRVDVTPAPVEVRTSKSA